MRADTERRSRALARQAVRGLGVLAGLAALGCPNPNLYGTPRTVAPGKLSHTLAVEAWRFDVEEPVTGVRVTQTVPLPPTYMLRIGATDFLDVGLRVANASSIGGDLKLNPLRTESFDLAVAPGVQWYEVSIGSSGDGQDLASISVTWLHFPLLLGFNASEAVSIVATPGVSYASVSSDVITSERDAASTRRGTVARFGLGANFRLSRRFALHPEVTYLRGFGEQWVGNLFLGLGFTFGALPDHGLAAAAPPAPAR